MQSCDPMKDTYAELDKDAIDKAGSREVTLELLPADFEALKTVTAAAEIYKNKSFTSENEAKEFVPLILAKKYLYLGEGAIAQVTYDLGSINTNLNTPVATTVTNDIYQAVTGGTVYQNFNSEAQIIAGAKAIKPNPNQGDWLKMTFKWSKNTGIDSTANMLYLSNSWYVAYILTPADYRKMDQPVNNSFSSATIANSFIPVFYKNRFPYKTTEGAKSVVVWDLYANSIVTQKFTLLDYKNGNWILNNGTDKAVMKFSITKGIWVADNTIKYTLTTDDHKITVASVVTDNEAAKASIAQYGNFDLKLFSAEGAVVKYLGLFLKKKFPDAAVGQKYLLTYKTFNPNATVSTHLILGDNGVYEEVK